MKKQAKHLAAALLVAASSPFGQSTIADPRHAGPDALESLSGIYKSKGAENWYGAYGTREFRFEDGTWSLRFVLALDPGMTKPIFQYRTHGPYRIGAESTVPRAYEAVFHYDAKHVTLLTKDPEAAGRYGLSGCGLKLGVEADISVAGCGHWKPVSVCSEDHDLLSLGGDGGLFFGVRPRDNDMCTPEKRSKELLHPAVFKH